MENINDWSPYYISYKGLKPKKVFYDKNWYCQENSIIHHSQKEVLNCNFCGENYYDDISKIKV
jgi:hypothetical protein